MQLQFIKHFINVRPASFSTRLTEVLKQICITQAEGCLGCLSLADSVWGSVQFPWAALSNTGLPQGCDAYD